MTAPVVAPPMTRPSPHRDASQASPGANNLCATLQHSSLPLRLLEKWRNCLSPNALLHSRLALKEESLPLRESRGELPIPFPPAVSLSWGHRSSPWSRAGGDPAFSSQSSVSPSFAFRDFHVEAPSLSFILLCRSAPGSCLWVGTPVHQREQNLSPHWGSVRTPPSPFIFLERSLKKKKPEIE